MRHHLRVAVLSSDLNLVLRLLIDKHFNDLPHKIERRGGVDDISSVQPSSKVSLHEFGGCFHHLNPSYIPKSYLDWGSGDPNSFDVIDEYPVLDLPWEEQVVDDVV